MSLQRDDSLSYDDALPSEMPPDSGQFNFPMCKNSMMLIGGIGLFLVILAVGVACFLRRKKKKQFRGVVTTLRDELENQKIQLSGDLERVTVEREENKRRLQTVETEITEREQMFEKPEELLREKEQLLRSQWNFDKEKEMCEREMLKREKLLEPIENQLRNSRKKKNNQEE
ncbi:trichohyalin-like [Cheilinus undulatus]|uniref:trichohyalin-like n=1 Tax=Cheilinus undulatus TaxID=241271 RepID=UPI001BD2ED0F|nr:trichohyalin-like [Cheilinus undulatus]